MYIDRFDEVFAAVCEVVQPADVTFVCLSSGVMESNENIERFQRLSDIAISAVL